MAVNRCHFNAAKRFLTNQADKVVSGFALSEGLWRSHTGVLNSQGRIIETTEPRKVYFGAVLVPKEILLECVDGELDDRLQISGRKIGRGSRLTEIDPWPFIEGARGTECHDYECTLNCCITPEK